MDFRLIAADLDDTLLDNNSKISFRSREAIRKAVAKGVMFVIATGRMFKTSISYMEELDIDSDCPLINYHGALIKTSQSEEVIFHRPLEHDLALKLVGEAEQQDCHISLFVGDELYIKEENEFSRYYQALTGLEMQAVGDLSFFMAGNKMNPSKISVICLNNHIDRVETRLKDRFGEKLSILQSRPYFLEITDRRATKGQALSWLAGKLGIKPEEVMAFGDGYNDLDMLEFAGLGVAVANARPEVILAADMITSSNSEDGVAEVIEKYVLEQSVREGDFDRR